MIVLRLHNRAYYKCLVNLALVKSARVISSTAVKNNLEAKFNFAEENSILKRINKSSVDQLVKVSFNFKEAEELKKFRKENGPFRKIEDLHKVPNLSEEKIDEVCLQITQSIKDNIAQVSNVITPHFHTFKEPLRNVVGILVGVDCGITWASLTIDYKLTHWGQVEVTGDKKSLAPHEIYSAVKNACEEIPESTVFIFESLPSMMPQQAYVRSYIERKEAQAMILAILNSRLPDENKVFFMRSKFPTKLFDIKVGNERTTSIPLVTNMLQGERVGRNNLCYLSDVDQEIINLYSKLPGVKKETYSNALLLAMTFLKLVHVEGSDSN